MFRRILVITILSIFLLVSCSEPKSSIALISSDGGEISLVDKDTSVLLLIDKETIGFLSSLSELGIADIIKALVPDAEVYAVPPKMYEKREYYLSLLMRQFGSRNRVDVLKDNSKLLSESKLLEEMDLYSSNYDSTMVKQIKNVDNTLEFELSSILEGADDWNQVVSFFSDWKDIII